ncbi:hypothetical protein, partial [Rhodovulum bhavnagarense]|uniref:hypothetical protein n=1 Tax=Rhodovulum bhavnagarense TaxID=992286 RepID=UPI001A9D4C79
LFSKNVINPQKTSQLTDNADNSKKTEKERKALQGRHLSGEPATPRYPHGYPHDHPPNAPWPPTRTGSELGAGQEKTGPGA